MAPFSLARWLEIAISLLPHPPGEAESLPPAPAPLLPLELPW